MISLVLSYTCYSVVVLRIEKGCIILMRPRLVPRTNIYSNNRGSGSTVVGMSLFCFSSRSLDVVIYACVFRIIAHNSGVGV